MIEVVGEVHPDAPSEAAVNLVVLLRAANVGVDGPRIVRRGTIVVQAVVQIEVQIEVRGAGWNAKVSAAARCSHPRSQGCRSRPSPMT